jgi:hypothetical protein
VVRGVNICVCTPSYVLYMKGSATEMGVAGGKTYSAGIAEKVLAGHG